MNYDEYQKKETAASIIASYLDATGLADNVDLPQPSNHLELDTIRKPTTLNDCDVASLDIIPRNLLAYLVFPDRNLQEPEFTEDLQNKARDLAKRLKKDGNIDSLVLDGKSEGHGDRIQVLIDVTVPRFDEKLNKLAEAAAHARQAEQDEYVREVKTLVQDKIPLKAEGAVADPQQAKELIESTITALRSLGTELGVDVSGSVRVAPRGSKIAR